MQTISGYPTGSLSLEPAAVVMVNGVPLEVESVSVSRELSSSLPEQVSAASGLSAATGNVSWSVGAEASERPAHPWDGSASLPKPSDTVTVDAGFGSVLARQLTGVIDSTSGSVASGDLSSNVVDGIDKLSRPVTFPAHLSVFPPHEENGPFLLAGNSSLYTTDRVLRACGFNATPPVDAGCILSVPLMGSAWPEVGKVISASQRGFPAFPPSFSGTQWGVGANSIDANYEVATSAFGNNRLDKNLQITIKVRSESPGGGSNTTDTSLWWGTSRIRLRVGPNREIQAIVNEGSVAQVFVASMSAAAAWTADVFTLRVNPGGNYTIYANNGATATGTRALSSVFTTTSADRATIQGQHFTSAHIGGVQIGFSINAIWNSRQTATLTPPASNFSLPAMPRIDGRNALEVLREQAAAECAAMWLDEFGHFRWVNRNVLAGSAPVATLTALDDVFDIGWESNASGVRSRVILKSKEAAISRSDVSNQTVWQGSGSSMETGQESVQFAEQPADVDWIDVDESFQFAAEGDWLSRFNWGHGSWVGGIQESDTTETWAQTDNPGFDAVVEKLGHFGYKITTKTGTPKPGFSVVLRSLSKANAAWLRTSKAEMALPIVRAKTVVEWFEQTTVGATFGPADAAALEHETGPWVHPEALQELADWLSAQVAAPRPVLRDLSVVPDPRRQLGDVVWVEGGDVLHLRLKVLITFLSLSVSDGSMEQSIGGRVLDAVNPVTNEQFDLFHAGRSNAQLDTLWAGGTNAQLDANPLGRG